MSAFVDDRYKVHVYLDTNILVDYVEQNNRLLNDSLEYLSNCPFVILRSSHYVEFEFVEVRKRNEFYKCVKGNLPCARTDMSFAKEWILDGKSYVDYKDKVTNAVEGDLKKIKNQLTIDFDDHVLHEKLIEPTKDVCLSTSISREDTLVMVSCVFPAPLNKLDFGVILSNDKQYKEAFENSKDTIEEILKSSGMSIPSFLNIKQLQSESGKTINLNANTSIDINCLWNFIIKQLIIQKNYDNYLGETIIPMKKLKNCIAIYNKNVDSTIYDSIGLIFIPDDLSRTISVEKNKNYWNNNNEIKKLPYINNNDLEYNLEISCTEIDMNTLCQKGNLVFYDNL
ncbi:MAG: hypothetical protein K5864_02580 [Bacteroidales bacterium]|nr:hypothetical protein [Bacteroidales bacterium]